MAMAPPERSKPLHNFSLPCLKWGNQRHLRCMKVTNGETSSPDRRSSPSEAESDSSFRIKRRSCSTALSYDKSKTEGDRNNGFDAIREKLMSDLRVAADKIKVSILEDGVEDASGSAAAAASTRPWNLRTRRAACKAPNESAIGGKGGNLRTDSASPLLVDFPNAKSSRLRGTAVVTQCTEKKERAKFSMSLSKEEVSDDFLAMIGTRPPRRPKKRAKIVQKHLDFVFPGLWLSEITPDTYKVDEIPDFGKG